MRYCEASLTTPPVFKLDTYGDYGSHHLCGLEAGHKGEHQCTAFAWCGLEWPNETPEHQMVKQSEHFASDQ